MPYLPSDTRRQVLYGVRTLFVFSHQKPRNGREIFFLFSIFLQKSLKRSFKLCLPTSRMQFVSYASSWYSKSFWSLCKCYLLPPQSSKLSHTTIKHYQLKNKNCNIEPVSCGFNSFKKILQPTISCEFDPFLNLWMTSSLKWRVLL